MVDSTEAGLVSSTVGDGLMGRAVVGKLLGMDVVPWSCEVLGTLESGIEAVVSSPIVFSCVSNAVVEVAVDETVGNVT